MGRKRSRAARAPGMGNLAEVGLPAFLRLLLDLADFHLELLRPGVLLRILPAIVRATSHVVGDHVFGLANEAAFFLGQSASEVELHGGLTCEERRGKKRVSTLGRPVNGGLCWCIGRRRGELGAALPPAA